MGKLKDLGLKNPNRKYDIYYNLPEQLPRKRFDLPIGLRHMQKDDIYVKINRFLTTGEEVTYE